jgi:hypothetical protein
MASEQRPAQAQRPCGAKTSNDMQTSIKGCRCASLLLCRVQRHERWSEAIPVNLFLQGDRFREELTPSYALLLRPDDENSVRGHFAVTQLLGSVAMRILRQGKDDAMWGMFAGSMAFVICGLLLLRSNFTVAIVTIAFFGSCAVVAAVDLRRKLRTRSPAPERVKLIGGVPLRPSRLLIGGIGIWMAALGLILATFGAEEGLIIQGIGLGLAALGCVMLIGMALGRLPADFLQFDPSGITLGRRGFAYLVRWDNIAGLGTGENRPKSRDPDPVASPRRDRGQSAATQDASLEGTGALRKFLWRACCPDDHAVPHGRDPAGAGARSLCSRAPRPR